MARTKQPNSDLTKTGEEIIRSENNKPTRGRGGKGNFPNSRAGLIQTEEDREFVAGLLQEVLIEYKQPKVKSDEELQDRLNDYFSRCANSGQIPTVEEMAMSTGFGRQYLLDIEQGRRKGFSPDTAIIIKKAKEFLATFDAKLVVTGKMNFLAYCFRSKNYYGMSDKSEYVISATQQDESTFSAEDMAKRYMIDDGAVETTFTD